ncbi:hypothetical protein MTO96_047649 [Rhipicephalus appendiculatus]
MHSGMRGTTVRFAVCAIRAARRRPQCTRQPAVEAEASDPSDGLRCVLKESLLSLYGVVDHGDARSGAIRKSSSASAVTSAAFSSTDAALSCVHRGAFKKQIYR